MKSKTSLPSSVCHSDSSTKAWTKRVLCVLRSIPAPARVACCALLLLFTPALYSCTDSNQHQASKPAPAAREHGDGPHLDLPTQEPVIRVRLQREDGRGGGVEVGTEKHDINLKSSGTTVTVPGPVNIKRTGNGWTVTDGSSKAHSFPSDGQLVLDADTPLLLNHKSGARRYGGSLHCVPSSDEKQVSWDLIEHVSVEAYLPGVLVGELYKGWTEACYSAQCVAARSFACMQIQHRTHHSYDVTDGPSSQAYHGVVDRSDAHTAQQKTSGVVLSWQGNLVPGYFSSCCGGRAANAIDAISTSPVNDIPPLMGHGDDDYCVNAPLHTWTIERSARSLGRRIAAKGRARSWTRSKELTTLVRITVEDRNQHGRPTSLRLVDRRGTEAVLSTEDFFFAANFTGSGAGAEPSHALWSGWAEGASHRGRIKLNGHGFGHGVGLCQYGAEAMGSSGKPWETILEWYYPGAELHKSW